MVANSSLPVDMSGAQSDSAAAVDHPVIRTLYDHLEEVTCLSFHPREQLLMSGSKDYTIKVRVRKSYTFSKLFSKKFKRCTTIFQDLYEFYSNKARKFRKILDMFSIVGNHFFYKIS